MEVASELYGTELQVKILQEDFAPQAQHAPVQVRLRLDFNNQEYMVQESERRLDVLPPVSCSVLFRYFISSITYVCCTTLYAFRKELVTCSSKHIPWLILPQFLVSSSTPLLMEKSSIINTGHNYNIIMKKKIKT